MLCGPHSSKLILFLLEYFGSFNENQIYQLNRKLQKIKNFYNFLCRLITRNFNELIQNEFGHQFLYVIFRPSIRDMMKQENINDVLEIFKA